MGRKRTWKWKYLYFCIASVIIIGCVGCSTFSSVERHWKARNYLSQGENYLDEGRWDEALLMHEKALLLAGKRKPRDTILYNMGLLYAHSGTTNMRYSRAILYFKRLAAEFPQSRHAERAKIWIAVLESLKQTGRKYVGISSQETNKGKIETRQAMEQGGQMVNAGNFKQAFETYRTIRERFPDSSPGDEALFNMAIIYAHHKNPEKNYKRSIEYFKQLTAQYQESPFLEQAEIWIDVLGAIEKSKQVDIEIEQKRKELTK